MEKSLNVVSFDVPFPANYGGVIDVYYKLVWLKNAGVKIHLHCFQYGREKSRELEELCEKVYYYSRKTGFLSNLSLLPYTVKSRVNEELEKNLLSNNYPILFEVLNTCYLLNDIKFKDRKKIFRHSNIEHEYYLELSHSEKNFLKKVFLKLEAWKLKWFERNLNFADIILAVNQKDTHYFKNKFQQAKSVYLPSFHPNNEVKIKVGRGDYILFHGNLSVSENYAALEWLIANVFCKIKLKVIIAGLNPPDFLHNWIKLYPNIEIKPNPSETEMRKYIEGAQVHVLYTLQPTGLKLKLLNVLYNGRFIVTNPEMLSGTGIKATPTLTVSNSPADIISRIEEFYKMEFKADWAVERDAAIIMFNNKTNVERIINEIFG